jgi:Flp pilus assembly protein TadD
LVGLGVALAFLERFDEALPWLNEAVTLRPNSPAVLSNLVVVLSQLDRIEEAKATLARFESVGSLRDWIETSALHGGMREAQVTALRRLGIDV